MQVKKIHATWPLKTLGLRRMKCTSFPAPQFPEFRMACKHQFFKEFLLIFLDLPAKLH